jgi:3-hydroxybutyrate dehydrogenase
MVARTALVTGSTSGIGLAIALELARNGLNILLNGLEPPELIFANPAFSEVSSHGTKVRYCQADLRNPSSIQGLFDFCNAELGPVDVLVNNAGIQHVAAVEDFPVELWDSIIATNLTAAFHSTRLALPSMRSHNWGRIINIASVHGLVASPLKSAYVAAKHGLVGFTKAVALETATTGVTVNAICPGWVLTPLVQKQIEARALNDKLSYELATQQLLSEKQPSSQFVTPEQIAELVTFLCSPSANNIRGAAWNSAGGGLAQ